VRPEHEDTENAPQPGERSIVIVSDLHLGGNEDHATMARFNRFLEALDAADTTPIRITDPKEPFKPCQREKSSPGKGRPDRIQKPETVLLLGDFLECWDSKDQNRDNVFFDAFYPLLKLRDMDCETIYVTGNHDDDIQDLIECGARLPDEKGVTAKKYWEARIKPLYENQETGEKLHGIKLPWGKTHSLHIHARAYAPPTGNGKFGIVKGGITYSFLHGHQFDKEQVTATLDEGFGRIGLDFRCDIIDFFEDIATISAAKCISPCLAGIMLLLSIWLAILAMNPAQPFVPVIGGAFGIAIGLGLLGMVVLFGSVASHLPSSAGIVKWCGGGLALIIIAALAAYFRNTMAGLEAAFFWVLLAISVYLTVAVIVPRIIAYGKRKVYNLFAARAATIIKILMGGSFRFSRFSHNSDVLIFGHTHKPDICHVPSFIRRENSSDSTSLVWILNTGSWVRDPNPEKTGQRPDDVDTFVYIDNEGVSLMAWKDETGDAACLCHIRNWLPPGNRHP